MVGHTLGPIGTLPSQVDQTGHGVYMLTDCSDRESDSGQCRLQLTLEDSTGRITGFVWPEYRPAVLVPPIPSAVSALGRVQLFNGKPQLKLQCLAGLDPYQVECAAALLPRGRCPETANAGLDRLVVLERSLPAPLNGFLRQVLLDPAIGIPLLRCRASVRDHHAFVGGLLVHCTESLDWAAAVTRITLPEDPWSPHVAQLAYLLHDLGKLKSVGETRRAKFGLVVRHETLTIEMLAPHLRWLEQRNAELANGLRYIFEYLALPFGARRIPEYFVAEVVTTMDHWSAAAHHKRDLNHLLRHGAPTPMKTMAVTNAANDPQHMRDVRHAG